MRRDEEYDKELQFHVDARVADLVASGVAPEEARRRARLELGGVMQTKEALRDERGARFLAALRQDLRYTFRTLRRDAGFATFAILIVGLGIGASSTVFSIVNALLLRPLPFHAPERLVWLANHDSSGLSGQTTQVGHLLDLREQNQSFSDIAGYMAFYGVGDNLLSGQGEPERLSGVPVSENFFQLLGVQPQLGRLFTPEECKWNGPKAVLITHGLWERRFVSDPGILGRALTLNDEPVTVVGVLPGSFDSPLFSRRAAISICTFPSR